MSNTGLTTKELWAVVFGNTSELTPSNRFCTCCGKALKSSGNFRWLELDQRTNTYHNHMDVPEENSQGWFPFGNTCAKRLLREHGETI